MNLIKKICALLIIICVFAGCSNKKNQHTNSYIDSYGRKIEISNSIKKQRIISVAPSMTELFFQLDDGQSLIARSDYCDYPPDAQKLPSVGTIIEPNIEYILALQPTLVVASDHFTKESVNKLEQFNIPVYIGKQGENLESFYDIVTDMGRIINKEEKATALITKMKTQISEITTRVQTVSNHPKVYYMISFGESGDYTAGKNTFIANLIRTAGGINIADDANGWAYSREKLFAGDPDLILISYKEMEEPLKKDHTYSKLRAVQSGKVYTITAGTMERPSLRNIDALLEMEKIFTAETK